MPEVFNNLAKKYGPIFRQEFRGSPFVILTDVDDMAKAFKAEGSRPTRSNLGIPEVYAKRRKRHRMLGSLYVFYHFIILSNRFTTS